LYCCRTRPEWDWKGHLNTMLGATRVTVTRIDRGESPSEISNLRTQNAGGEA
jgi:hypothetical protein